MEWRNLVTVMAVVCAVLLAGPAWGKPKPKQKFYEAKLLKGVPDKYVVMLSDGISASIAPQLIWEVGGGSLEYVFSNLSQGFIGGLTQTQAKLLSKHSSVAAVYQDTYVEKSVLSTLPYCYAGSANWAENTRGFPSLPGGLDATQGVDCLDPTPATDPQSCVDNWGLDRISHYKRELDELPVEARSYTYRQDGSGIKMYVVDSGIFPGNREFDTIDNPPQSRAEPGKDTTCGSPTCPPVTKDCSGHGTHVAAIAAGRTFGVAKYPRIVPVRVACSYQERSGLFAAGIDWIAGDHNALEDLAIVNISGGNVHAWVDPDVDETKYLGDHIIGLALKENILIVQSAGNFPTPVDDDPTLHKDACNRTFGDESKYTGYWDRKGISRVLVVGASDLVVEDDDGIHTETDTRFVAEGSDGEEEPLESCYGSCVDIWAPAAHVSSAWGFNDYVQTSQYAVCRLSGTSMAAPVVSGIAAVILGTSPYLKVDQLRSQILFWAERGALDATIGNSPNLLVHWDTDIIFGDDFESGTHDTWSDVNP